MKTTILSNVRDKERACKTSVDVAGKKIVILPYDGSVKYLGKELSFDRSTAKEVENHISESNTLQQSLSIITKIASVITLTILYDAGSWTMTTELEHRLKKVQRSMLRALFQCPRKRIQRDENSQSSNSSENYQDADSEDGTEL